MGDKVSVNSILFSLDRKLQSQNKDSTERVIKSPQSYLDTCYKFGGSCRVESPW